MTTDRAGMPARIGVIGAGLMGTGIAALCAAASIPVVLVDAAEEQLDRARPEIERILRELVEAGLLAAWQVADIVRGVEMARSLPALAQCDFVLEAIPEKLPLKQELYRQLETQFRIGRSCCRSRASR